MAAKVAKSVFRDELARPEVQDRLRADPLPILTLTFANAHKAIEEAFRKHYEELGWLVERAREGYLTRMNKNRTGPLMCIHGGTTATVLVVLDGRRIVVANVGDSTAIIAGLGTAGALHSVKEWTPMPPHKPAGGSAPAGAARSLSSGPESAPAPLPVTVAVPDAVASSYMELSADHSPESHTEFQRMQTFRPHGTLPHHPELLFVYDTLTSSKLSCPPIFDVDSRSGKTEKTERGSYYKNVRCEWATLVATPPHAPYQDALAFTRSLGDLHLQTYGVSHTPEVWWMDLMAPGGAPLVPYPLSIVVASDGIWDNWKFEEVAAYVLAPPRLAEVLRSNSAQAAAGELMATNLERGRANFGSSADNMTAITLYLIPKVAGK
jgi:serine/threonine protein phosphatase PrpC